MKKVLKIIGIAAIVCAGAASVYCIVDAILGFRATSDFLAYRSVCEDDDFFED